MPYRRTTLALVLGLSLAALGACANQPLPGENPTPARVQPTAPPPPTGGTTTTSYVREDGVEVITTTFVEPDPADPTSAVVEGEVEVVPEDTSAVRQAAVENCYNYAWSQVAHDQQIQHDRASLFDMSSNADINVFTTRLEEYGNEKRRGRLFDDCMSSMGYGPNQ